MAITLLHNQAQVDGVYDEDDLETFSSIVEVRLVDGITVTKTANKEIWSNGELIYTVVLDNTTELAITDAVFLDQLDITLIDLVANSVLVDGTSTAYTYNSGLLTVSLGEITGPGSVTIQFSVVRV